MIASTVAAGCSLGLRSVGATILGFCPQYAPIPVTLPPVPKLSLPNGDSLPLPAFEPSWYLRSGHVQTAAVPLMGGVPFRERPECRRIFVDFTDDTGDRTDAYVADAADSDSAERPLVILFHGLGGDADSAYVTRTAARLLDGGFDVMTPNFRGAGTSAELASELHHPGRSGDVQLFLDGLRSQHEQFADRRVVVGGFSLGGHVLLKYLADRHTREHTSGVVAGFTVSAPLSLRETSLRLSMLRNLAFCQFILRKMKAEYTRPNGRLLDSQRAAIAAARTVWQFDAAFTSGYLGYDSVDDFYCEMSAIDELSRVDVPTVMIHAEDDPFVPSGHYHRDVFKTDPELCRVLTTDGGHVGFFEGRGSRRWLDDTLLTLLHAEFWTRV